MKDLFGSIIAVFIFVIAVLYDNMQMLSMSVYVAFLSNIIYSIGQFKKRFVFFAFNVTFFTFLISQMLLNDYAYSSLFQDVFMSNFSNSTQKHVYKTLTVSLIAVFGGYRFWEKRQTRYNSKMFDYKSPYIISLRNLSKQLMYFFLIFAVLVSLEKVIYVQRTGYVSFYTDFHSNLPFFISRLANFYDLSVFLFLATIPRKKEVMIPIGIFLLIGCMSIGYGQRNGMVLNALFVMIYYVFREYYKFYGKDEKWITKKMAYVIGASLPLFLVFLFAFSSIRSNQTIDSSFTLSDMLYGFFYSQGESYKIIGLEREYANDFPSSFPYSLGYFVDLYEQNYLYKVLGIAPSYEPHSLDAAMKGHNFGDVISYLYYKNAYFEGFGLGSCYIAEIYHDFGYIGLILLNFTYGVILASLCRLSFKSVWHLFVVFCVLLIILYAPRSAALYFLSSIITVSFLGYLFVVKQIADNRFKRLIANAKR